MKPTYLGSYFYWISFYLMKIHNQGLLSINKYLKNKYMNDAI